MISQVRKPYSFPPYRFLLLKLSTSPKSKKYHQEDSNPPGEIVQAQVTEFAVLRRQENGLKQMWVDELVGQTAPSRVGEGVRRTGPEAQLCHRVARGFRAPHTVSLSVCLLI